MKLRRLSCAPVSSDGAVGRGPKIGPPRTFFSMVDQMENDSGGGGDVGRLATPAVPAAEAACWGAPKGVASLKRLGDGGGEGATGDAPRLAAL
jgi:hypothetical protein